MADKTSYEDTVTREEAADLVQELARELRDGGPAEVRVGNKTVALTPAESMEYAITTEERSPMLGGRREEITIDIEWKLEKKSGDGDEAA